MKIPSSSPAVRSKPREFRADRIPAPKSAEDLAAAARVQAQITAKGGIDLEIGCGVGWHPIRYAVENPERAIVAIERTTEKFEKFRTRLARKPELTNLIAVHADAVAWITHHIPDAAGDRIFLFYPNPNPKNPQARWVRMPFFGHLVKKLGTGGRIELRTNIAAYAEEFRAHAPVWGLLLAGERRIKLADGDPRNAQTHFERKYLERGETCFVSEWERRALR